VVSLVGAPVTLAAGGACCLAGAFWFARTMPAVEGAIARRRPGSTRSEGLTVDSPEVLARRSAASMTNARCLSIVLSNDRREIPRLADLAQRFGDANGLSLDDTMDIRLVLDELVINVIRHGYDLGDPLAHEIHVRLELDGNDCLTMEVDDDARPFDPRTAPEPEFARPVEERRIGGLGVHIVKTIMDTFDYRREHGRNVVTLTKQLRRSS
jgi:anti-sigma regulatory factor (Ser/Thr protein kinase)